MAGSVVVVPTTAAGSGAPIAVEVVGTTAFQQVKLVAGQSGATAGLPGTTAAPDPAELGLVVRQVPGVSVSIQGGVSVTVQQGASVVAQVSGTVAVPTVGTVLGTVAVAVVPGVSVVAVVSGTVTALLPGSTTGSSGMSGILVWLGASQTVVVSTQVSGTVTVSGTALVSVVPGVSVVALVSGTVTALLPGSTTGSSGMSGVLVWLGASQSVLIAGQSVTVQAGLSVTVVTQLGTQVVSVVPGVSVQAVVSGTVTAVLPGSTTGSSGMSGVLVWLGASQTVIISTQVSGTVSLSGVLSTVQTIVTVLGTQVVSVVPGLSVSAVVSGTVTAVLPGSTTGSSGMSGVLVWFGASQTVLVSTLISGTVTAVPADRTTATPSAAGTGAIVWVANPGAAVATTVLTVQTVLGTAVVSVVPGVSVVAVVSGTVTVGTGTVVALAAARTNVVLVMTSTSVGVSGTMMLFTAYQGITQSAAGTTGYVVPAGKTFRVLSIVAVVQNSVTTSPVTFGFYVVASTAAPTWTTVVPVFAVLPLQAVSQTVSYSGCAVAVADIPAGATVGLPVTIGTSGGTIAQAVVQGYLFP